MIITINNTDNQATEKKTKLLFDSVLLLYLEATVFVNNCERVRRVHPPATKSLMLEFF